MTTPIFDNAGITKAKLPGSNPAYFSLKADNDNFNGVFLGYAPVVSITATQSVDLDLHKALNGAYLLADFGFSPVNITMKGIDIFKACSTYGEGTSVQSWWNSNNAVALKTKKVKLSLCSKDVTNTYDCVVVSLTRDVSGESAQAGTGSYALSLIGVKIE